MQVLVSIQAMIFIADPYFNEPGYEATANSNNGQAHSRAYNKEIKLQNLTYGLLAAITKPPPAFKDVLKYVQLSLKPIQLAPL